VDGVGPTLAEQMGEAHDKSWVQTGPSVERGDRPARRFEVARQRSALFQRDEVQREARTIRMPGELDEQLFLAADVETSGDVEDVQYCISVSHPWLLGRTYTIRLRLAPAGCVQPRRH
jgi:hypothetical protein